MKTRDIATELDRAFAAATRHALMNGVVINDRLDPCSQPQGTQCQTAGRELTDEQYTEKARELLWIRLARKCAVPQNYGLKSQDRAGAAC